MHMKELLPQGDGSDKHPFVFLSERTMLSLHVVIIVVICVIWIIRLSDKVDTHDKEIKRLEKTLGIYTPYQEGIPHDEQ